MAIVSLVPFEPDRHTPLVAEWLRQPHVAPWWGDADTTLAEIAAHPVATEAIIEADGEPVGFVVWQTPTRAELIEAGLDDLPADLVDIDIMIGVAERLGRGVGPEALHQLLARLQREGVATVGLGTATANRRALRAYAKAGFRPYRDFHESGQDMRYFVRNLAADAIIDLYERHAAEYDRDRGRTLLERAWLDTFLSYVPDSGTVLDLGCGTSEPIAHYIVEAGRRVLGVDSSPSMIALCRARLPASEWVVGDMRKLALQRRFAGILAWDSFSHLQMDDQREMLARFAAHASPGAPLMFTSGTSHGERIGSYRGEPLYHASLDPAEYGDLLHANGFDIRSHVVEDPQCGGHTIWLATYAGIAAA